MKLRPLEDRVIVKAAEAKDVTPGGLTIPDVGKEKPQRGEVVAVGPGKHDHGVFLPMNVRVGDEVLYGKYAGNEVVVDDVEYLIVRESDVLAIFK